MQVQAIPKSAVLAVAVLLSPFAGKSIAETGAFQAEVMPVDQDQLLISAILILEQ